MNDYPYTNKEVFGTYFKVVGGVLGVIVVFALVLQVGSFIAEDPEEQQAIIQDTKVKVEQLKENTIFTDSSQRTVTYSVNNIPTISDTTIPEKALDLAIANWEKNNENIKFIKVFRNGDLEINWKIFSSPTHAGLATCYDSFYNIVDNCVLDISLGNNDCNGNYVQADMGMVTNTIMHEIGHALGLEHHSDINHLMFGEDYVQVNFDNLGYNIPIPEDEFYVGQEFDQIRYNTSISEIEKLEPEINRLNLVYEKLYSEYAKYEGRTLDPSDYNKATALYDQLHSIEIELNPLIERNNMFVERANEKANILNCFPNVEGLLDDEV